jgi:outer membrane receptor for ferrienterochelin and colicin
MRSISLAKRKCAAKLLRGADYSYTEEGRRYFMAVDYRF